LTTSFSDTFKVFTSFKIGLPEQTDETIHKACTTSSKCQLRTMEGIPRNLLHATYI